MFSSFHTKLAGVKFGNCQQAIRERGHRDIGYFSLQREPENPHDPNGIGVWFLDDRLGYLQKSVAKKLAPGIITAAGHFFHLRGKILIGDHFQPQTIPASLIGSCPPISKSVSTTGIKPKYRYCTGRSTWPSLWGSVSLCLESDLLSGLPTGDKPNCRSRKQHKNRHQNHREPLWRDFYAEESINCLRES